MYLDWNPDARYVTVRREKGDPRMSTESQLLAHLQHALRERLGVVLIKRPMWRDGHMVADTQYYLRSPNILYRRGRGYTVHDAFYSIRDTAKDYNAGQDVRLYVDTLYDPVSSP